MLFELDSLYKINLTEHTMVRIHVFFILLSLITLFFLKSILTQAAIYMYTHIHVHVCLPYSGAGQVYFQRGFQRCHTHTAFGGVSL